MKKTFKILCIAAAMVLALAGVSFATSITYEYINPSSGDVGARVYLDYSFADELWTYTYQVENVAFDPDGSGPDSPILHFDLPVLVPLTDKGTTVSGTLVPVGLNEPTTYTDPDTGVSTSIMTVDFLGDGLMPGLLIPELSLSDTFFIVSQFGPKEGIAVLTDGESDNILVLSNLGDQGGGNTGNPVPEPATLLLLGMGALGLEGFRRLKSRKG